MTIDVWQIDLRGPESAFQLDWLDAGERARLQAYKPPIVKLRFARSHAALRGILAGYADRPPATLRFTAGSHGKPVLLGESLHFNLAHSGHLALLAVSPEVAVGVDVEEVRPLRNLLEMAHTVFHAEEIREFQVLLPREQQKAFFECWVRREALVKGLGMGLAAPRSVGPAWRPGSPVTRPCNGWEVQGLDTQQPYRAAVAAETFGFQVRSQRWPPTAVTE